MNLEMLLALQPLLAPAAAVIALMLLASVRRHGGVALGLTLLGLVGGVVAEWVIGPGPWPVSTMLVFDGFTRFFVSLLFAGAGVVAVIAHGELRRRGGKAEEFFMLLLLGTIGAAVLVASTHFASLFLGLEILSVSLYTLIAYERDSAPGLEAGIKYLVLAGTASAFLLFGLALLYAQAGTMELAGLSRALARPDATALAGLALASVGVGFKLAVVPFHLWTPDVYQGAPASVAGFIATVSKGGMFAVLLRFFLRVEAPSFRLLFAVIAIASMLIGNLLALRQESVKRILAYSSIAHMGYLLIAFLAAGPGAVEAVAFYLAAYFATTLAAFGVVSEISGVERDADSLEDFRGLAWRRPLLAGVLAVSLFSLAGIPLTAGFVGKFYVLGVGVAAERWVALFALVAGSAISIYYYLRVVIVTFQRREEPTLAPHGISATVVVLGVLLLTILWLGISPQPLLALVPGAV